MQFKLWLESNSVVKKAEKLLRTGQALFHASHTGNLAGIHKHGLIPQHGPISKSTDAYQQRTMGVDRNGKEFSVDPPPPATFFGEDPGNVHWQIDNKLGKKMNQVTQEDIEKHGLVVVVRKNIPQIHNRENPHEDEPPHVEEPDHYSMDDVYPKVILTGRELMRFIRNNFPDYLNRFPLR